MQNNTNNRGRQSPQNERTKNMNATSLIQMTRNAWNKLPGMPTLAMALAAGAACSLFTGCAATQIALEHKNLKVQTQMSHTIFLDAEKRAERSVFLDIKNTS